MKIKVLYFFLFCVSQLIYPANQIKIEKHLYHIDHIKKMVLINMDLFELNMLTNDIHEEILLDQNYIFINPQSKFELNKTYNIQSPTQENYTLFFTQLPVININTDNEIVDEPRTCAQFQLSENNGMEINQTIGIEYRGGYSQAYPKKSFRIEFWNTCDGDSTKDISLLGMRNDDDWNLQAMYNEPLRVRSKFNHDLWKQIDSLGHQSEEPDAICGVKQEYVELFVNNEYRGLYALSERIDRKQLKLEATDDNQIRGELYKGILWGASTFSNLPSFNNNSDLWGGFKYKYPTEFIDWNNIYDFVNFVVNKDSSEFYESYKEKFDIDNAVNYYIFLNLLRATDNTGKNIYVAKYSINHPYFYIPWDLDGTLGILWNGKKENITDDILTNGFYIRLTQDQKRNGFLDQLKRRWNQLRRTILTEDYIIEQMRSQYEFLKSNGVYDREIIAWPNCSILDENNLEYTEEWLNARLLYLDYVFNSFSLQNIDNANTKSEILFYPNPVQNTLYIRNKANDIDNISIFDSQGKIVFYKEEIINNKIDVSNFMEGIYFIQYSIKNRKKNIKIMISR